MCDTLPQFSETGREQQLSISWQHRTSIFLVLGVASVAILGCWQKTSNEIIVYTALDSEFSEPILNDFSQATRLVVRPKFDVESTKTVGLTETIIAEAFRPRCDVFWNNEILHTIRLAQKGLLEEYRSPVGSQYPAQFRSPKGLWYGFAARARVLLINTDLVPEEERPTSILDLTRAKWKGRSAIAKPLFGTTATHAACLFSVWGEERAKKFFQQIKTNQVQILSGNKQVATSVAAGQIPFGLTDTDDAVIERNKGMPVVIVYPDQGEGELGTLFIPNTLSIIKGCPHPKAARQIVDYLLSAPTEARLAVGASAQIPLQPNLLVEVQVETPQTIRPMAIDYEDAARQWDTSAKFLRDLFSTGS